MTEFTLVRSAPVAAPKIGFVSLGCPKALTDSELILTQLRAEGYDTSKTFAGADLVIVNTCGFIDDAVKESLDTIGEALAENGKVIVTGCLGAKAGDAGGNLVRQMHPSVLAVTGPHATQEVMNAVHLPHQVATTLARFGTEAAGHDDLAVGGEGFPDGVQAFLDRIVNETAGVDDHQIGAFECLGGLVTLGIQLRQDQFGVGQRLGAAQADETHFGCRVAFCNNFAHK